MKKLCNSLLHNFRSSTIWLFYKVKDAHKTRLKLRRVLTLGELLVYHTRLLIYYDLCGTIKLR